MTSVPATRVCVFAGSSPGRQPAYIEAARVLGRTLAARRCGLVYGGARVGLMGTVADAMLDAGGTVTGVIPQRLVGREIAHPRLTELHVVESMHQRKALMVTLADRFIALPGGLGTFEELFEVLTWAQLGIHRKPCGLLNIAGYYDPLLVLMEHAVGERFLRPEHAERLIVESDVSRLLTRLEDTPPASVDKWLDRARTS